MKKVFWILITVIVIGITWWAIFGSTPSITIRDYDCANFATHEEAQAFFESNGGPARDPHKLDQDKDGVACETLP
ncbi:MAG: excalibur calcium-binding domain-containing protein [Candidatus Jorgensenbacteria bacterium]|nr:excalibur calcium-binding domain-containing protein [Candidatus Jorgensenbacteria bacterium]